MRGTSSPPLPSQNCPPACPERSRRDRSPAFYVISPDCPPACPERGRRDRSAALFAIPLNCHPDRSGPTVSPAPLFGASGRAVEGSRHHFQQLAVTENHAAPLPHTLLMLFSVQFSRSGGTGRRSRLKICRGSLPVWVRLPPPGPSNPRCLCGYLQS